MFKRMELHLTGPICGCDESNLCMRIDFTKANDCNLVVSCKTCDISLTVPWSIVKVFFKLDVPYPSKPKPKPKPLTPDEQWAVVPKPE